jgi:phosphoribosyl 1,2-cyclic phosphodiesterase
VLNIQTLASGSGGNAIYISSETTAVLVDCGLSVPRLLKRFEKAKIDPKSISAVVITHEHIDHIVGLESFMNRFPVTLYLHEQVTHLFKNIDEQRINTFSTRFNIGDITVDFFSVPHDSKFCFGYSFTSGAEKISIATDLGRVTDEIIECLAGSQIVMLECNHDTLRLNSNKRYPIVLKRRISGSFGHLSNPSCALAVYNLAKRGIVEQVILAHLSEENNSPTLAFNFVKDFLLKNGIVEGRDIFIDVALQDEPGKKFVLGGCDVSPCD